MAKQTFKLDKTSSSNTHYSGTEKYTLPTGLDNVQVVVKNSQTGAVASSSSYSHNYNASNGELSVTFSNLVYTSPLTYNTANLQWAEDFGTHKICHYTNGSSMTVGSTSYCPSPIQTSVKTPATFKYDIVVTYETNKAPTLTLSTTDARTLYENDTIGITGVVQDADAGNVMTVKYTINGGTTRAIHTSISDGSQVPFNRTLTFRNKRLYDGQTAVTGDLQEGAQNTIKVWAEDDQGGRSEDVYRSFQVVPNRPATLTINPVEQQESLIDSDSITISGSVNDPDGNTVTVEYRLFGESFEQVYNGAGGNFSFNVQLSRLNTGDNNITIRATDSYGATTTRTLKVTKAGTVTPLKRSIATYRINPTNGTAQGVVLWIQRDSGDLNVTLEISATAEGETEVWEPMALDSTAFVEDGIEEDEWIYEATEPKENILIRMTLERENTNSTAGVRLISGVLS